MIDYVENKKIFSEAEKDVIIEEILQEKPWSGVCDNLYFFLRKWLITIFSFFISFFVIIHSFTDKGIFLYVGISLPFLGYLWDKFVTFYASDLHMTDRDWVTLVVKGGKVEANFKHMWIIYVSMLCISSFCLYYKIYEQIYFLQFFLFSLFYSISFSHSIPKDETVFENIAYLSKVDFFDYHYQNKFLGYICIILELIISIIYLLICGLMPFLLFYLDKDESSIIVIWWAVSSLLVWIAFWSSIHFKFPLTLRIFRLRNFCIKKYDLINILGEKNA